MYVTLYRIEIYHVVAEELVGGLAPGVRPEPGAEVGVLLLYIYVRMYIQNYMYIHNHL